MDSGHSEKSPDAFRTISEVAEDLDLPQHVLRFWETRFTQIKPLKRGGGRRYYRPQDVDLIRGIRFMLYDRGFTIKGVQKLLREQGNQYIISLGQGELAEADLLPVVIAPEVVEAPEDTVLIGKAKPKHAIRLFGLGQKDSADIDLEGKALSRDDLALLQETLFDLLECKRLLDQVR